MALSYEQFAERTLYLDTPQVQDYAFGSDGNRVLTAQWTLGNFIPSVDSCRRALALGLKSAYSDRGVLRSAIGHGKEVERSPL
jgi:hypothetical protein